MLKILPPLLLLLIVSLSAYGSPGDEDGPVIRWDLVERFSLYDPMEWRAARTEAERRQSFAEEAMERAREMKNRPDRRSSIDGTVISNEAIRERGRQAYEESRGELEEAVATLETLENLRTHIEGAMRESDFLVLRDQQGREVEAAIYARDGDDLTILSRALRPFQISLDSLIEGQQETIRSGRVPLIARRLDFVPASFLEPVAAERVIVVEGYDPSHRFLEVSQTRISPIELEEGLPGFLRALPREETPVEDLWEKVGFVLGTPYHRAFSRIRGMAGEGRSIEQEFVDSGRLGYLILEEPGSLQVLVFDDGELRGIFTDGMAWREDELPGKQVQLAQAQQKDEMEPELLKLALYQDALVLLAIEGEEATSARVFSPEKLEAFFSTEAFSDLLGKVAAFFADPEAFPDGVLLHARVLPSGEWFEDPRITRPFKKLAAVVLTQYLRDRHPPVGDSDLRVGWKHFFWTTTEGPGIEVVLRDGRIEVGLGPVQ